MYTIFKKHTQYGTLNLLKFSNNVYKSLITNIGIRARFTKAWEMTQ